jgi:serine protease inhibitor
MIEREPSVKEMVALWHLCADFIEDHQIRYPEDTINDWVYENATNLIENICEEIGYHEDEE